MKKLLILLLFIAACQPKEYSADSDIHDFASMQEEKDYIDSLALVSDDVKFPIKRIVLHCTAGYPRPTSLKELNAIFKSYGWDRPGYHGIVDFNYPGQEPRIYWTANLMKGYNTPETVRYGASGHNANSIHLAFVGSRDKDDRTPEQNAKMLKILRNLKRDYYPNAKIIGHNDLNPNKACPRFNVRLWLPIDLK
jgi:N-acetylmuramoyl-L-alanine amidase